MKIAIGADHGGFRLKEAIRMLAQDLGHEVEDVGCFSTEAVNYPNLAQLVCEKIQTGSAERGILICGTGLGMSMAANKYKFIRAALCHDHYTARLSREHNNANLLCLGERVVGIGVAEDIVRVWLLSEFSGGRHQTRIALFSQC